MQETNENYFFIEDHYLSSKNMNKSINKYIFLGGCSENKVANILNTLNTNIKYVKICEDFYKKSLTITIKNKEFIKVIFDEINNTQELFIFNLPNNF